MNNQKMQSIVDRRNLLLSAGLGASGMLATRSASGEGKVGTDRAVVQSRGGEFALALGGGGARGIGHIPVLEALDELGLKPKVIAGTSIGSIMGACYANGMSGGDLRKFVAELFDKRTELVRRVFSSPSLSWTSMFQFSSSAIIKSDELFKLVLPPGLPDNIETLPVPLKVVATDFFDQSEVILDKGPLLTAIGASSALPALLSPVEHAGRVLIDGGFVNPTPFDVVANLAQHTIAVDLTGHQAQSRSSLPTAVETLIGATQIAMRTVVREKLARQQPDLLITPKVKAFDSMDFYKTKDILAAAESAKEEVKRGVHRLLEPGNELPVKRKYF